MKTRTHTLLAFTYIIGVILSPQTSWALKRVDQFKDDPYHWPKTFSGSKDTSITLYQPQITDWENYEALISRSVIIYQSKDEPIPLYGTIILTADTSVDQAPNQVHATDLVIENVSLPSISDKKLKSLHKKIQKLLPKKGMTFSLERVIANYQRRKTLNSIKLNYDAPPIFISHHPSILVILDGQPIWSPIKDNPLKFAMNTNWDLFWDEPNKTFYLRNGKGWLSSNKLEGNWRAGITLPEGFSNLPNDSNWKTVKENLPGLNLSADDTPDVYVSFEPAELIQIEGKPNFGFVINTNLTWLKDSKSIVFYSSEDKYYYYLVSGRWFRSQTLANNANWEFATDKLPEDFLKIPDGHPRAQVRVSIPGTPEAETALILSQIPKKSKLKISELKPTVSYSGEPKFKEISGTSLSYAVNSSSDVIKFDDRYYLCQDGVWFEAKKASGPWKVSKSLPKDIYKIPPESPMHRNTYVHIYGYTPGYVTVGYTAGYSNVYVSFGVTMYGTGYHYNPYAFYDPFHSFYPNYYYYPYSYGANCYYDPYSSMYYRAGWGYGPYGGMGYPTVYSSYSGTYARGEAAYGMYGSARYLEAYNPKTNTSLRSYQGSNYYESWGASALNRDGKQFSTASYRNSYGSARSFVNSEGEKSAIVRQGNNLYAGKDGNVYRRHESSWQKYDNGSWADTNGSFDKGRAKQKINEHRDIKGSQNRTLNQNTRQQLNRDLKQREYGQQRFNQNRSTQNLNRQLPSNFGNGQWRGRAAGAGRRR